MSEKILFQPRQEQAMTECDHPVSEVELEKAVAVIKTYLRKEFIVEECRKAPCFGCASCEAVSLERRLDGLLAVIG